MGSETNLCKGELQTSHASNLCCNVPNIKALFLRKKYDFFVAVAIKACDEIGFYSFKQSTFVSSFDKLIG